MTAEPSLQEDENRWPVISGHRLGTALLEK
jgi:hypothetical protein